MSIARALVGLREGSTCEPFVGVHPYAAFPADELSQHADANAEYGRPRRWRERVDPTTVDTDHHPAQGGRLDNISIIS
jgi:hypothetical protein